jgi:serine/threonine protein kinase/tetratricopeptide (TPR) repeat protein
MRCRINALRRRSALIGRTLAHYKITAAIGAGGMGQVYRATDAKLGREVALKVLPPDMARDPERLARFQREARAVAALNHPHIVTVYSVEEAEGIHFLTMELVEGHALNQLIPEGGLPVQQIIEIAIALSDALAAAHDKGIIHRDMKPGNVMVTGEGRVKVLDFGLAKELRVADSQAVTVTAAPHTEAGIVMGTPAYMSPEQVSGRPLDHRTDIFSLGIILYQMTTGRRPFEGRSAAELASSILRDTPAPLDGARSGLPGDLTRIIRRCLEKEPRNRIQTARDIASEFRDLARRATAGPPSPPASGPLRPAPEDGSGALRAGEGFWVAVLPFKYSGANADLAAFAEGLSEEIVTGLARYSYLRVISRSSTSRYVQEGMDVRAAGKELGAQYVMEGSLRHAGSRLRIAVQLVDATSGAHLWAESYDRAFQADSIFELQDDLVPRIVSTIADMNGVLTHSMGEAIRSKNPAELTPYEALLRGCSYEERMTAEDHAVARDVLERAVREAPNYADCWAMLSILYVDEYKTGFNVRPDSLDRGLAAARCAVELAPSNHFAPGVLASAQFFRKERQAFRISAERSLALNPMDGGNAAYLGMLIAFSGDWDRGCALTQHAMEMNAHHLAWFWFASFFNAYRKRDYPLALSIALKINFRGIWGTNVALAAAHAQVGELEAARAAVRDLLALRPDFADVAREELSKWWDPLLVEQLIDGLRKAGLEIAPQP